ncbi:MAG: sigma-70 family RNA polymerase sigma factor [Oscillospiraceae bacterium]|nr:sigma-70 family RNA polymerase sigma factor [Oscillospiraceae bacterium]
MDEQQLIRQAQSGEVSAFEQLLDRYQKPVYHQALRLVSHPEDAADVTQEVFLKVWKYLPTFRGESSFSTWLYRMTDNAALDLLRREKKRRGDSSLDDDEGMAVIPVDPAATPQEALERSERQRAVSDALGRLSEEHRRVLVLREINGLSYEEIGQVLELAPGTVKSRIARARTALANILRQSGNFFD